MIPVSSGWIHTDTERTGSIPPTPGGWDHGLATAPRSRQWIFGESLTKISSKMSLSCWGLVCLLQLEFAAIPLRWNFPVIIGPLLLFINLFLQHYCGFHSPATLSTEENLVFLLIYDLPQSLVTMLHRCSHLEVAGNRKHLCFKHSDRVNTAELSQQAAITERTDSLTARFFLPPKVSHLLSLFLLMTSIMSNKADKSSILL